MKKSQGFSIIPVLAIVMALVVLTMIGWATYMQFSKAKPAANQNAVACTQDAKVCADGTSVGRVAPSCQFAACPETNTNVAANTNTTANTNTAANVNATPEVLPAGVKRYTSDALGVTFTYLETAKDYHATVSEIGDKVYIAVNLQKNESITTGQWVQVMSKDPNDTLQQAIEKKYLQGYDPAKCYVRVFPRDYGSYYTGLPTSVTLGIISYPHNTTNDSEPWWSGNSCPADFSETNGIRYFWMDSAHPEKLLFFSIGQYAINGLNDPQTTWQETLRISDNTTATADWKTYTSSDRNFSFRYPPDWILTDGTSVNQQAGQIVALQSPATKAGVVSRTIDPGYSQDFAVSYWPTINWEYAKGGSWIGEWTYKDLADFFTDSRAIKRKTGEITLNGTQAFEVTIGGEGANYGVMVERNGIYELSFQTAWAEKNLTSEQKGILSTFTFPN